MRKLFKKKGISENDLKYNKGHLFNWFTNLNEDNTLDADKPLKKQGEGVRKAIFEYYKSRPDDYIAPKDIEDLDAYKDGERFYKDVIFQMRREGAKNPQLEASKLLAKLGIKGLTYNGRQDGRCFVSFEGGATVKLQDPFTFNDAGELIPLTERFDSSNPDMRWSRRRGWEDVKDIESLPFDKNITREWHSFPDGIKGLFKATDRKILENSDLPIVEINEDVIRDFDNLVEGKNKSDRQGLLRRYVRELLQKLIGLKLDIIVKDGKIEKVEFTNNSKREVQSRVKNTFNASIVKKIEDVYKKGRYLMEDKEYYFFLSAINIGNTLYPVRWSVKKASGAVSGKNIFYDVGVWTKNKREFEVQQIRDNENPTSKTIKLSDVGLNIGDLFFPSQAFKSENQEKNSGNAKFSAIDSDFEARKRKAMLSEMMLKYGIRGYKYKSGYGRNKNNVESWNYVSFEGGNALKRREVITRDKEGKIIPPSERYDKANSNWNFSLVNENTEGVNLDVADENREGKTLSALLEYAKKMHADGVSMSTIFKRTGWEFVDVGRDTPEWIYDLDEGEVEFPIGLELNTPVPLKYYIENKKLFEVCPFLENVNVEFHEFENDRIHGVYDHEKKTIVLSAKFDTHSIVNSLLHETQHAIDRTNYIGGSPKQIFNIIKAAHTAKGNINEHYQSAKARELSRKFYELVKTTYKLTDEIIDGYWTDWEDAANEKYLSLTGEVMARNAGARHTIDRKNTPISITEDANIKTKIHISEPVFKDIVDLFERMWDALGYEKGQKSEKTSAENNKGFSEGSSSNGIYNERIQGEYRPYQSAQNYSLAEEETSEKERKKLEREKEARAQITSPRARIVQATTDAFAPLAALERVLYGKVRGAEKSAWKMALMTKNLDQVIFHVLRVGGIAYDKVTGEMKHRKGSIPLEKILNRVRGKNYKNFEHYALAKCAIEHWAKLRKQKFYSDKDFANVFGFTLEDARKWASEGTENTKKAFADLQKFFQDKRDFMLETGLISEKQHQALSEFKNYVPFFREGADLEAEMQEAFDRAAELNPGGRGMSARNSGIQKFIGSSRKTKNLIESIVNQTRREYDAGYKNIAMYRSLNLMRQIGMATYLKQDTVEVKAKLKEMKRALEKAGVDVGALSDEEIMQKAPIEAFAELTAQDEKTNDNIDARDVKEILKRIKDADKDRNDSKKAGELIKRLANAR